MAVHEIEVSGANAMDSMARCTGCDWLSEWSILGDAAVTGDMVIDFGERTHLSSPLLSGQMVIIAGARLTRRDNSFVGRLGDKTVIIQAGESGLWAVFLNETGNLLVRTWFERVSEAVRASQRHTNDSFA
jgi:hypothetical protein